MSMPIEEHDYIGLSEAIPSSIMEKKKKGGLNLKATELRLGLPGCESPERDCTGDSSLKIGLTVSSGAKRGFSDAITDPNKWVFPDGSHQVGAMNPITTPAGAVPPESANPALHENIATIKKPPPPQPHSSVPASKTQVVGWPPIRASRKNLMAPQPQPPKTEADDGAGPGCLYVKVSMDGAPFLRKVDLKIYGSYKDLSSALEKMFTCFTIGQCGTNGLSKSGLMDLLHGSEFVLTYEDKDGDWMLVGDVPWQMFTGSCKRLRIMKSSDAIGLAPRAMEKCKNRN